MRGRFAPSPTGRLHLGNLRTCLLAWLQVRRAGGRFVLRMEDIDRGRSRAEYAAGIFEDLRWLGFDWDEGPDVGGPFAPYTQSERLDRYREVLARWQAEAWVYPCTCSRKDLLAAAGAPHAGEEGPVYPGTCREALSHPERPRAWRFHVPRGTEVRFADGLLGGQAQDAAREVGDFIVWRNDGWPSYQMAVVCDDADMEITDVVRGADLLASTARQILLFGALGRPAPRWHHVPLWLDDAGERLAKRSGGYLIADLRTEGVAPEQALAFMARSLGWATPDRISLGELLDPRFVLRDAAGNPWPRAALRPPLSDPPR